MAKVIKDTPDTTIIDFGYQIYIDTTLDINNRLYGTFMTQYVPVDNDLLFKKVSPARDLSLKRRLGDTRYLHIVNKTKADSIKGLSKLLTFTYEPETKDTRDYIIDREDVQVIDYSPKSVGIFPYTGDLIKIMQDYEGKFVKYISLTGPKLEKKKGYILAKSSSKYGEILKKLDEVDSKSDEEIPSGDGISAIGDLTEPQKIKIWGDSSFIASKLEEIDEQKSITYSVVSKKNLDDGRKLFVIEIKDIK